MNLLFYFLVTIFKFFTLGTDRASAFLLAMVLAVGRRKRHWWKASAGLQAPETLIFPLSSQHCPWRYLSLTVGDNEVFWLQTQRSLSVHPWHPAAENRLWAAHQLSTPKCNLPGAAKLLSTHLDMSCHWGKHWMAIGWAWIINPAELWNSSVSVSQMGPLWPVSLLLCCLKYHTISDIPPYYQVV